MMKSSKSLVLIFIFIFIFIAVIIISNKILSVKVNTLKNEKFISVSRTMKKETKILIDEKLNATLALAISLTFDNTLKNALKNSSLESIKLDKLSLSLKQNNDFKNVWFQIISSGGDSFYRSWVNERGDSLLKARKDVVEILKNPKIMTTISVGKYDMTFKSMIPMYNEEKLLGIVEVITHFNSIAVKILKRGIEPIIVVDKKYKQQLIHPFTKLFIGDYYIANLNANPKYMSVLREKCVDHFLDQDKEYYINEELESLITIYRQPDIRGKAMGYIVLFKPLIDIDIDMSDVYIIREKVLLYILGFILLIASILYYFKHEKFISEISLKNTEMQRLNSTLSLSIKEQNSLLSIFDESNSVLFKWNNDEEWSVAHVSNSISKFLEYSKKEFLDGSVSYSECIYKDDVKRVEIEVADAMENNLTYFEHHPYRVLTKSKKIKWVIDQTVIVKDENGDIINFIGFISDISEIKKLENDNQDKDRLLFQQSKMASMGEMIGNIAHQWRQPISIISMWANNIIADIDMEEVDNKSLRKYALNINAQTKHLSQTIDDFRNFFTPNKNKNSFTLKSSIDKTMSLLTASFKTNSI